MMVKEQLNRTIFMYEEKKRICLSLKTTNAQTFFFSFASINFIMKIY